MVSEAEWREESGIPQLVKLMSLAAFKQENEITRLLCYSAIHLANNELGIE